MVPYNCGRRASRPATPALLDKEFIARDWPKSLPDAERPPIHIGSHLESLTFWLRGLDLNQRPLGYEPNELPGCSTPHLYPNNHRRAGQTPPPPPARPTPAPAGTSCPAPAGPQNPAPQCDLRHRPLCAGAQPLPPTPSKLALSSARTAARYVMTLPIHDPAAPIPRPGKIVVATDLTDTEYLVPHAVAQARASGASLDPRQRRPPS